MVKEVSINKMGAENPPFCTYSIERNRKAMLTLTKSAYYLYTYFLQNQDGYTLTLRRTHVMNVTGLSKTSYYEAFEELIKYGYIVDAGDGYEFYEDPDDNDEI